MSVTLQTVGGAPLLVFPLSLSMPFSRSTFWHCWRGTSLGALTDSLSLFSSFVSFFSFLFLSFFFFFYFLFAFLFLYSLFSVRLFFFSLSLSLSFSLSLRFGTVGGAPLLAHSQTLSLTVGGASLLAHS